MGVAKMRRVRLIVEYDGTGYSGWQRQINAISVQQRLEEAIARLTGQAISVVGSSRTDAGVHALGLNVHFDTDSPVPDEKFSYALNTMLPPDIRVRASMAAPEGFHARFGATGKVYRYMIYNFPHAGALNRNSHWHVMLPLNLAAMQREAARMVGRHDFGAFAASGSIVKDTVRTIYRCQVDARGSEVRILVHGNGFLYNMVRILAGTLVGVGEGRLEEGAIGRAIESGDRLALGVTAPAHGLTLMRVFYGDDDQAGNYFEEWV